MENIQSKLDRSIDRSIHPCHCFARSLVKHGTAIITHSEEVVPLATNRFLLFLFFFFLSLSFPSLPPFSPTTIECKVELLTRLMERGLASKTIFQGSSRTWLLSKLPPICRVSGRLTSLWRNLWRSRANRGKLFPLKLPPAFLPCLIFSFNFRFLSLPKGDRFTGRFTNPYLLFPIYRSIYFWYPFEISILNLIESNIKYFRSFPIFLH